MTPSAVPTNEALFARYRERGDAEALATVFDRLAPQLLLVAAHLAGGAVAEDLVQATFLDAIRQRDRWDATRPFVPWLVGVLGNHVRRARRERARMPVVLRLPVREVERPDAVLQAGECAAMVHAAVERLPRHYRQVLSLRLVHGLELQQIAHSLDVPLGTVKVRLHRGVDLLRRTLPAGLAPALAVVLSPGVGLAAVRQVVVANAGVAVGAAAVGVGAFVLGILGGLMMKKIAVAVAVVVALVGTWLAVDAALAGPVAGAPTEPMRTAVVAPLPAGTNTPANPAAQVEVAAGADAVVRDAAPATGGLDVQVVWASDEAPAAGVFVMVTAARGPGRIPERPTDAGGKVALAGLAAGSYSVVVTRLDANVRATADVVVGEVRSCRLAVDGDVRLKFVVVDAAGAPQAGAIVASEDTWHAYGPDDVRSLGTTDVAGVVRYRGLPIQNAWAQKAGRQPSPAFTKLPGADRERPREEIEVGLVLGGAGCVVTGAVVDPRGQPVPSAQVVIACEDELVRGAKRRALCVHADAGGRFSCDEVPAGERTIAASGSGFAPRVQRITTSSQAPTSTTLVLQIGATLSGRVTDADGQPLARVSVTTGPAKWPMGIDFPWGGGRAGYTDADGRYRLEALLSGETDAMVAIEPAHEQQFLLADGEHRVWDVVQPAARRIHGRVLDHEGQPLRGWWVEVREARPVPFARSVVGGGRTNTEAGGRFEVGGLEAVAHRVLVFARDANGQSPFAAAGKVPRAVVENVQPSATELEIRIDAAGMASGWIEGSLVLPAGLQVEATLTLDAKVLRGGSFTVPRERLDAGVSTFRLGPLPAGEYDLSCDIEGRGRLAQHGIQLAPNATLQLPPFAFDAQRPVQLLLRHADGRPVLGAEVKLRDLTPCREAAPGRYESVPVAAGSYEAVVRGPDCAPCTFAIEFRGDEKPHERTVPPGTAVQFVVQPPVPRERWIGAMQVFVSDASGTEIVRDMVQIDGKNEFVWPLGLRPGMYSIRATVYGEGQASAMFAVRDTPLRVDLPLAK